MPFKASRTKSDRREREFIYMLRWRGLALPPRARPKRCECCGGKTNGKGRLHYDHDHETGAFRGWLCHHCNVGLGHLGDSIEGLKRALDYLRRRGKPPK